MSNNSSDSILDMFIYESSELITQLEDIALDSEESNAIEAQINEVFRIVHTVKGASAMMEFNNIASLSHSLEDVFYYIRENHPNNVDYSALTDLILKSTDYIKSQIAIIQSGGTLQNPDEVANDIEREIKVYLAELKGAPEEDNKNTQKPQNENKPKSKKKKKADSAETKEDDKAQEEEAELAANNKFKALLRFESGCEMENIRAFNVLKNLENTADIISTNPKEIPGNEETTAQIKENGFEINFGTDLSFEDMKSMLSNTLFLKELYLEQLNKEKEESTPQEEAKDDGSNDNISKNNTETNTNTNANANNPSTNNAKNVSEASMANLKQSIISVNLDKLDILMDLVGELVISQEMVVQNSELNGIVLNNFQKASGQLRKVTNEIQDAVMAIRMVPISATFNKMHRIVRDMSKKLGKEVKLEIIGEETEVDKNVIEHLTDPLMHIIRNSMDHGIESAEERENKGKPAAGKIILEAKNEGGEVWIVIKDDGKGLDRDAILKKAIAQGLVKGDGSTLTDREINALILLPGFSTKKEITEFSGRGVGMDVVHKNMEEIGGTIQVDSIPGEGTTTSLKIPLTLAIIAGMKIRVGNTIFVIPITSIKESFRAGESSVILDECNNNELIMLRGDCIPILRLYDFYNVKSDTTDIKEGIIIVVENNSKYMCLFADEVIGEQQVVVKALPKYIKKVKGISGCTVMGDGSVSLIVDVSGLFSYA